MSFLDFTNRLLGVVKFAAEMAFDIMSPEGMVVQGQLPHHYPAAVRRGGGGGAVYRYRGRSIASQSKPADLRNSVDRLGYILNTGCFINSAMK
jgi:hypothetical protein